MALRISAQFFANVKKYIWTGLPHNLEFKIWEHSPCQLAFLLESVKEIVHNKILKEGNGKKKSVRTSG